MFCPPYEDTNSLIRAVFGLVYLGLSALKNAQHLVRFALHVLFLVFYLFVFIITSSLVTFFSFQLFCVLFVFGLDVCCFVVITLLATKILAILDLISACLFAHLVSSLMFRSTQNYSVLSWFFSALFCSVLFCSVLMHIKRQGAFLRT